MEVLLAHFVKTSEVEGRYQSERQLAGNQPCHAALVSRALDTPCRSECERQVEQQLLRSFQVGRSVANEATHFSGWQNLMGLPRGRAQRALTASAVKAASEAWSKRSPRVAVEGRVLERWAARAFVPCPPASASPCQILSLYHPLPLSSCRPC